MTMSGISLLLRFTIVFIDFIRDNQGGGKNALTTS
jgi:hypothetical protein